MTHLHSIACFVFLVATAASFPLSHNSRLQTARRATSDAPATVRGALRKGVTFDLCKKLEDCEDPRKCWDLFGALEDPRSRLPCTNASSCLCLPEELQKCKENADCEDSREICIQLQQQTGIFYCASRVASASKDIKTVAPRPDDEKRPGNAAAGKTMQICSEDFECKGNRKCISARHDFIEVPKECTNAAREKFKCICLPDEIQTCTLNADCEAGEVCARLDWDWLEYVLCVSADMEPWDAIMSVSDDIPRRPIKPNASEGPEPSAKPTRTLDEASSPGEEEIIGVAETDIPEPSALTDAIPSETVTMEMRPSDDADGGFGPTSQPETVSASPETVSASPETVSASPETVSASPETVSASPESVLASPEGETESEAPSETEDPICVDAGALSHFGAGELVFGKHSTARVLCDSQGSCATEGHMVVFKSRAMMMRSYCLVVKCSERTIEVNSPKYRRGLRIPSKTEGLHFTSFAARYSTKVEEMAIHIAIRAGL